jgi:hypothetical protein
MTPSRFATDTPWLAKLSAAELRLVFARARERSESAPRRPAPSLPSLPPARATRG